MTNQEKLNLIQNTNYNDEYAPRIEERDGVTYVNCSYDDQMYPLDDIVLFEYDGVENLPILCDNLDLHFVECENCGKWLQRDIDDIYITGDSGNHFCEHCSQYLFWCDHCEQWQEYEDDLCTVNTRYGQECWCQCCTDNNAFYSEHSEEYFSDRDFNCTDVYDEYGNSFSATTDEACDNYYWCEECQEYYTSDAFDHDSDMCLECAESNSNTATINRYHTSKSNNTLKYFGVSKYVNWCGIGFELEVDTTYENKCRNQQNLLNALKEKFGDRITFESDGSLDYGFEIISAPHTKDEMNVVDWAELMQICKDYGYRSHDTNTCGLHFHVSGYMFGATKEKQHDTIAKVITFYERYFEDFVKLSRRGSVTRWAKKYGVDTSNINYCKNICKQIVLNHSTESDYDERYRAINLTNCDDNGLFKTVEFRINRGTLNYNTFRASYNLILTMIKNAKKIEWNDSDFFDPKRWFKGCEANTYAYINKRGAFEGMFYVANANAQTEYTQEIQA